ncbi:CRE-TPH-1 protein [Ditylenchus destructor]|nr:CRE-TPH-1 protein [Ditylenchus destructor]
MASGLKFLYYNQKKPARRTVSSSTSEYRLEEFKRRFRRSGSLGVPFFPEEEVWKFKNDLTIQEVEENESGSHVITVIVRSSKSAHNLSAMLQAVPKGSHVMHLESRDPKSGGPVDQIEVLMEVQLDSQHRPNDLLESIQRSGFEAQELTRTVNPRGAVEVSDPGSTAGFEPIEVVLIWF